MSVWVNCVLVRRPVRAVVSVVDGELLSSFG